MVMVNAHVAAVSCLQIGAAEPKERDAQGSRDWWDAHLSRDEA
jgi:hypothetical protein